MRRSRDAARSGDGRWKVLTRQALADGMIASMVVCFVESLKKPERQSGGILAHNKTIVFNGIAALEDDVDAFAGDIDVGTISVAVALAFADQTFPEDDWRTIAQPWPLGSMNSTGARR